LEGNVSKPLRGWTLVGCAAAGVVFYVGWLQWSRVLALPPLPVPEPAGSTTTTPTGEGPQAGARLAAPGRERPAPHVQDAPPRLESAAPVASGGATLNPLPVESQPATAPDTEPAHADLRGKPKVTPGSAVPVEESAPAAEPDEARDKTRPPLALGGWVRDQDGSAAAGVPVMARARRLFAVPDDGAGNVPMPDQRAVSDGGGRFGFEALPDGEYELRTNPTELYEKAMAVVRAGVDSAVLVVEKKSGRALFVHGVVESSRGGPLKGVRVEVVGQPRLASISDESGGYGLRLPVSAKVPEPSMRFLHDGYREQRVTISAAEAADGDDFVRDVRLDPAGLRASVTGVVTAATGPPLPRANVQLYSARVGRRYQAVTDSNGRFTITDVEESDDYRLWVHAEGGYRDHVREPVEVPGQSASLDVALESLSTSSLRGSMVDPEGRALAGFTLWLRSAYGGATSLPVTGDTQGRFAVGDLSEGPVALETRAAPQLAITGISLTAGSPREVLLVLDTAAYILEGYVLTDRDEPFGGARVSLQWLRVDGGLSSRSFRETFTDARGYFVFTQLGAGAHTLSVTAPGFRNVRLEPQVGPGLPPVEIKLPASP